MFNDGTRRFPRIPVTIRRLAIVFPTEREDGTLLSPPDVIGCYARYVSDGKLHIDALGQDTDVAYIRFLQIEGDVARVRHGLEPIHVLDREPEEPKENRSLRTCAAEFKSNIMAMGKKKATIYASPGQLMTS